MRDEDIQRFVDQFDNEGYMRRRRNRRGRGQPPGQDARDRQRAARRRDIDRRADRDEAHDARFPEVEYDDGIAERQQPEAAPPEPDPEVLAARLKALRTQVADLAEIQISVRHKGPTGARNTDTLIAEWRALDTAANSASAEVADMDALESRVADFNTALRAMDEMFEADPDAAELYSYAVALRPIDRWPEITLAAEAMNAAIVWPVPDRAAYVSAADTIRKGKAAYEDIKARIEGQEGNWLRAQEAVKKSKGLLDSDFVRIRNTPAVDPLMARLEQIFGGDLAADNLNDAFVQSVQSDIDALENWAVVIETKVKGPLFEFLEAAISEQQGKHDTDVWDFERERDALKALLSTRLDITGDELQRGFDAMLAKKGPWTKRQDYQRKKAAADQEKQRLVNFLNQQWGRAMDAAGREADRYLSANSRAATAFTRFALTEANYTRIKANHRSSDDSAIALLLSLPAGSDTARVARCLVVAQKVRMGGVTEADVENRIVAGDAVIAHERHFEYRPGRIEAELAIRWSFDGMPGSYNFAVVHIHYNAATITNNSADVAFAHLKDWTARQAGGSSETPVTGALLTRSLLLVPNGTTL